MNSNNSNTGPYLSEEAEAHWSTWRTWRTLFPTLSILSHTFVICVDFWANLDRSQMTLCKCECRSRAGGIRQKTWYMLDLATFAFTSFSCHLITQPKKPHSARSLTAIHVLLAVYKTLDLKWCISVWQLHPALSLLSPPPHLICKCTQHTFSGNWRGERTL